VSAQNAINIELKKVWKTEEEFLLILELLCLYCKIFIDIYIKHNLFLTFFFLKYYIFIDVSKRKRL